MIPAFWDVEIDATFKTSYTWTCSSVPNSYKLILLKLEISVRACRYALYNQLTLSNSDGCWIYSIFYRGPLAGFIGTPSPNPQFLSWMQTHKYWQHSYRNGHKMYFAMLIFKAKHTLKATEQWLETYFVFSRQHPSAVQRKKWAKEIIERHHLQIQTPACS